MSEIKHLLPQVDRYFKANLHTHTDISDGRFSPEETKELYKSRGYQIVAFTDHDVCIAHPELEDPDFLPLTSYELEFNESGKPKTILKTYHLCFIAKDKNNRWQSFDPNYCKGNRLKYKDQVVCDGYEAHDYSLEKVNKVIADANAKGFLVTYNHPSWSLQDYTDYIGLKGLWAMEVYNHECNCIGQDDNNSRVYQDLLRQGNRLFAVATDDFHQMPYGQRIAGGWVMVGAKELTYASVIEALEKGAFYASTGPEIQELSLEGTKLKIRCSDAKHIMIFSHCRQSSLIVPTEDAATVQEAEIDLAGWIDNWNENDQQEKAFIRIIVTGTDGQKAYTRAYWYNELV